MPHTVIAERLYTNSTFQIKLEFVKMCGAKKLQFLFSSNEWHGRVTLHAII